MKFINGRGKPLALGVLGVCYLFLYLISSCFAIMICDKWYGLIVGGVLMLVSVLPQVLTGHDSPIRILSALLNGVAMGFMTSAYYLTCEIALPSFGDMFEPTVIIAALLIVICIVTYIVPNGHGILSAAAIVISLAVGIFCAIMWIKDGAAFYSFGTLCAVHLLISCILIAVSVGKDERGLIRDFSLGTFGIAILAGIIILVAIACAGGDCDCDCDGCDGCDCCDCSSGNSAKSGKKAKKKL